MFIDVLSIVGLTVLAGACIPLGGLLASFERIRPNWLEQEFRHFVIALGGGILLGAVAVVFIRKADPAWEDPFLRFRLFLRAGSYSS